MLSAICISDGTASAHDRSRLGVAAVNDWPSTRFAFPDPHVDRAFPEDHLRGDLRVSLIGSIPLTDRRQFYIGCPEAVGIETFISLPSIIPVCVGLYSAPHRPSTAVRFAHRKVLDVTGRPSTSRWRADEQVLPLFHAGELVTVRWEQLEPLTYQANLEAATPV